MDRRVNEERRAELWTGELTKSAELNYGQEG